MARRPRAGDDPPFEPENDQFPGLGLPPEEPEGDAADEVDPLGDLGALSDPDVQDIQWFVYRMRPAEELKRGEKQRVLLGRLDGAIDINAFHADHGGGTFQFLGKRGRSIVKRVRLDLEGPPRIRSYNDPAPAAPVPSAPPLHAHAMHPTTTPPTLRERQLTRRLRQMEAVMQQEREEYRRREREMQRREEERARAEERRALEMRLDAMSQRIETLVSQRAEAAPPRQESLRQVVEAMVSMRSLLNDGGAAKPDTLEFMKLLENAFARGYSIGEGRPPGEGGEEGEDKTLKIVEAIAGVATQFLSNVQRRQARPPGRPAPPPSGAEVVDPPRTAAAAPQQPQAPPEPPPAYNPDVARWNAALQAVARGVTNGTHPEVIATTLEGVLNEEELSNLIGQNVNGVWNPTVDQILGYVQAPAPVGIGLGPFPQLDSPGGRTYLESVLAELRRPTDDDAEE